MGGVKTVLSSNVKERVTREMPGLHQSYADSTVCSTQGQMALFVWGP